MELIGRVLEIWDQLTPYMAERKRGPRSARDNPSYPDFCLGDKLAMTVYVVRREITDYPLHAAIAVLFGGSFVIFWIIQLVSHA